MSGTFIEIAGTTPFMPGALGWQEVIEKQEVLKSWNCNTYSKH
jgi:hypothetical protein